MYKAELNPKKSLLKIIWIKKKKKLWTRSATFSKKAEKRKSFLNRQACMKNVKMCFLTLLNFYYLGT